MESLAEEETRHKSNEWMIEERKALLKEKRDERD